MLTGKPYPIKAMLFWGCNGIVGFANFNEFMKVIKNLDFVVAVDRWMTLKPLLAEEPASQAQVQDLIDNAVAEAKSNGIEVAVKMPDVHKALPAKQVAAADVQATMDNLPNINQPPAIKAWVSIDSTMLEKAAPTDTVFVFAKARSGPPMPLAAFKTTVDQLPMEVTLDDSSAMMPQMKLSLFDEVVVSARVSKSGEPRAMPGDLTSAAETLQLNGVVAVELTISEQVQ